MNSGEQYRGVQTKICDRTLTQEINEDFSLPDYQPEIRRLLRVAATVPPAAKYIGSGKAEFSGSVVYNILYSGSDGGLYSCRLSTEYSFDAPLDTDSDCDLSDNVVCFAQSSPDMIVSRVTAPRKLNIKCRLRTGVRAAAMRSVAEQTSGAFNPSAIERLTDSIESSFFCHGVSEPLSVGDEMIPEALGSADMNGNLRVIDTEGNVFINEAVAVQGAVNCRGELAVRIMYCRENESADAENSGSCIPQIMQRKIPVSISVELDGAMPGDDCRAWGHCPDISVTVEDGRFICSGEIVAEAEVQRNEKIPFTRDMYATDRECECTYTDYQIPVSLRCTNGNFTQSGTVQLSDMGVQSGARLVDISGIAVADKVECERGRYIITGKCRYTCLLYDGGEPTAKEFELPLRYELDGDGMCSDTENIETDVDITPVGCRARVDGERLGVDTEMAVAIRICSGRKVRMLSRVAFGEPFASAAKSKGVFRICYPGADDTLWSIAKKYKVKVCDVSAANSLAPSDKESGLPSLDGVKYLIV